jgi:hypothetical protein
MTASGLYIVITSHHDARLHCMMNVRSADFIVSGALEQHRRMVREFQGAPGVLPERLQEGLAVRHCALSLVWEVRVCVVLCVCALARGGCMAFYLVHIAVGMSRVALTAEACSRQSYM